MVESRVSEIACEVYYRARFGISSSVPMSQRWRRMSIRERLASSRATDREEAAAAPLTVPTPRHLELEMPPTARLHAASAHARAFGASPAAEFIASSAFRPLPTSRKRNADGVGLMPPPAKVAVPTPEKHAHALPAESSLRRLGESNYEGFPSPGSLRAGRKGQSHHTPTISPLRLFRRNSASSWHPAVTSANNADTDGE